MRRLFAFCFHTPRLVPVLLSLGLLLAGCGAGFYAHGSPPTVLSTPTLRDLHAVSTAGTRTYLGAVSGTQILLGLVLSGTQVRAYACDGTPSRLATVAEWLTGQVNNGNVEATSQDQARLFARLGPQSASGRLTEASGRVYAFTIPQVPTTARVGVFEGVALLGGKPYHAGWLLLPDGEQRGAASYYPIGPTRGQIVIGLVPEFPSSPI